jgi:hypothetical protein
MLLFHVEQLLDIIINLKIKSKDLNYLKIHQHKSQSVKQELHGLLILEGIKMLQPTEEFLMWNNKHG